MTNDHILIFTSTNEVGEVLFSPLFVCLSVCLSVCLFVNYFLTTILVLE